jgi:hypothetical protein
MSRHYRVDASVGFMDRAQDWVVGAEPITGAPVTESVADRFALLGTSLTGDTTRFQEWGAFQGKRFTLGVLYGANAGGDIPGDLVEYSTDFRAYKQLTRRSLLAWRLAAAISAGGRPTYYSLGGFNQLRGYDFRDYFGTRVAWSNLELRFPLVDQLRFPFGAIRSIRGFLFMDVGAAWSESGVFYDPELGYGAIRIDPQTGKPIKFTMWDSANSRLMDGRGSYGWGFQFMFVGGLQFNWTWAQRMAYTRYEPVFDGDQVVLVPKKGDVDGWRYSFYIVYDF